MNTSKVDIKQCINNFLILRTSAKEIIEGHVSDNLEYMNRYNQYLVLESKIRRYRNEVVKISNSGRVSNSDYKSIKELLRLYDNLLSYVINKYN